MSIENNDLEKQKLELEKQKLELEKQKLLLLQNINNNNNKTDAFAIAEGHIRLDKIRFANIWLFFWWVPILWIPNIVFWIILIVRLSQYKYDAINGSFRTICQIFICVPILWPFFFIFINQIMVCVFVSKERYSLYL